MRNKLIPIGMIVAVVACSSDTSVTPEIEPPMTLRVVNAYASSVDILVDGNVYLFGVPAASVTTVSTPYGTHNVTFRANGVTSPAQPFTAAAGALPSIAVVSATSGSISTVALDDTNSVVPANATKLRVLHFAANAGTLQVYRTQPDYPTPISWQFPFTYQNAPNSLSAPFYQSTVGTWEIHIWQTPADASGWASAPVKVIVPLAGGEKRTIVILDKVGGGVRVEWL